MESSIAEKPSFMPHIGQWVKIISSGKLFKVTKISFPPSIVWIHNKNGVPYQVEECAPWTPKRDDKAQWDGIAVAKDKTEYSTGYAPGVCTVGGVLHDDRYSILETIVHFTTLAHLSPVIEQEKPEPKKPIMPPWWNEIPSIPANTKIEWFGVDLATMFKPNSAPKQFPHFDNWTPEMKRQYWETHK